MNLWIFDNDGTLYDDFGTGKKFMEILIPYASSLLNIPIEKTEETIKRLKTKWGTEFSVLALKKELNMDFSTLVANTYLKIDMDQCNISPNTETQKILTKIDSPKIVFTNNPSSFAKRVISYLKIDNQFIDFIGVEETDFHNKPDIVAYRTVEDRHPGYSKYLFCDDSLINLDAARDIGWQTFWLKPKGSSTITEKHITINSLSELEHYI